MLKNFSNKVNVIGFNIAGALSSIALLNNGYEVNVYEKYIEPKVVCSGIISVEGSQNVEKFFNPKKAIENVLYGANIYLGRKLKKISIIKNKPVAYVYNRKLFDTLAREEALKKGASVVYKNVSLKDLSNIKGIVVGADGPFSIVAKYFNYPPIENFIYGYYTYVESLDFSQDKKTVSLFLNSYFPGFFGWIIPRKDCYELGFGVENPKYINQAKRFFEQLGIKHKKWVGSAIPIKRRKRLKQGNSYLVGDSTGLIKSSTGGGIVYTSIMAEMLVKSVRDGEDYEKLLLPLSKEQQIHLLIKSLFNRLYKFDYRGMYHLIKLLKIDEYLLKHGNMDLPSKFLNPLTYINYVISLLVL